MANEIYTKSWWGSGVCDNAIGWGSVYKPYANCGGPREQSFVEKFGEPISAYSLRNLTSNLAQPLVQVTTNGEVFFDLVEEQITIDNLKQYENLRVTKWYDQAGDDETLTAFFLTAPYLVKDGKIFTENLKPTIHFENGTSLNNQLRQRPILDTIRTYNVSSYSDVQEELKEGQTYNIFQDVQKIPTTVLLGWFPKSKLTSKVYTAITQNIKTILKNEEDNTFTFETPTSQLNLYNISDGLRAPFNFLFGDTTIMNVSEFILYPTKDENNGEVTENLIEYYGIKSREFPPIGDEPGFKPKGKI